jgi:secondary thiamine-phosphate synthase enzyme
MIVIPVQTTRHRELLDVTEAVRHAVRGASVAAGLCCLFVPHTTAGITINENADPDVATDLLRWAEAILGDEGRFRHWEGNAGGHILASLFGNATTVPVAEGDLALGRWQAIYLVEGDGPRRRELHLTLVPAT